MTSTTRVAVIGAGLAGARFAQRLGELAGAAADVTLIGEESHPPYNRVLLAEVLAGRLAPEVVALPTPAARLLRARAERIDREARTVHCADGSTVPYDTLVLATGSNPVLPPLRGLLTPGAFALPKGVHAFRTMDDCLALSAAVRPGVRSVIVGGGLLGVSAARALARRGAPVVLVQQSERLMERQLDPVSSQLVHEHLTALGVEIHTESRARGIKVAEGAVTHVEMADGYLLDTDLLVLACGVRPRIGLAAGAGLDVREGITVDAGLRTSDPHIHAIGDCAEHDGQVYGLAAPALEQAESLAQSLAVPGTPVRYRGTRALTRLTLSGENLEPTADGSDAVPAVHQNPLDLAVFGRTEPLPGDDVVQLTDATRGTYRKVIVRGEELVGGVLLGELASVGALARAWEGREPVPDGSGASTGDPLLHLLTHDGGS